MAELREARPADRAGIRELFHACYQRDLPGPMWAWRLGAQPDGYPVSDVAIVDGAVVAHLSAWPVRLDRGGTSLASGLCTDLMVHPRRRSLDLFLELAQANLEHCRRRGLELLFAFPNDRSHPLFQRVLGWTALDDLQSLEAPLADLAGPAPARRPAAPAAGFGSEFARFWDRVRPSQALVVNRRPQRLRWRYGLRPGGYPAWTVRDAADGLCGWIVLKTFDAPAGRIGDVLEFWSEDDGAADALWTAALAHFRANEVAVVSAWAMPESPMHAWYRAHGLAAVGPRTHFAGLWCAPAARPFPKRPGDWQLSKGDSDVF